MRLIHGRARANAADAAAHADDAARAKRLSDFRARLDRRYLAMVAAADFDRDPRRASSRRWNESNPDPAPAPRRKKKPAPNPRI